jgi:hypothetical protein
LENKYADNLSDIPSDFEDSESYVSTCESDVTLLRRKIQKTFIQVRRNPWVSSNSEESD